MIHLWHSAYISKSVLKRCILNWCLIGIVVIISIEITLFPKWLIKMWLQKMIFKEMLRVLREKVIMQWLAVKLSFIVILLWMVELYQRFLLALKVQRVLQRSFFITEELTFNMLIKISSEFLCQILLKIWLH